VAVEGSELWGEWEWKLKIGWQLTTAWWNSSGQKHSDWYFITL
jgi:hypothetical protein